MLRLSRSSNGVCPCSQIPHMCFLEASRRNILRQYIVSLLTHTLLALKSIFAKKKFGWHQVQIRFSWSHPYLPWAGPLVSLTGAAPSDHTFTLHSVSEYCPLKPVNTIYIIFQHDNFFPKYFQKILAAFSYQYLFLLVKVFFCMHYAILFTRSTPKNMAVT